MASMAEKDWPEKAWTIIKRVLFPEYLFNRKVRVTKPGMVFLGILAAVAAASFNTGNNMLYLVLAIMLGALLVSFMVSEYVIRDIKIKRIAPERVTRGVPFRLRYKVTNEKSAIPSAGLLIEEEIGRKKAVAAVPYVRAGKNMEVRTTAVTDKRGRARFQNMTVQTSIPFGWFRKTKRIKYEGELISLPRPEPEEVDRESLPTLGDEKPVPRPGRSEEIMGFRAYRRGDPVRDVHWKTTARTGKLTVREREKETELRLRIRLVSKGAAGVDDSLEEAVTKAASVAAAALEEGWQVRVETEGRGVDFDSGSGHLSEILYFLAMFDDPETPAGLILPPTDAPPYDL